MDTELENVIGKKPDGRLDLENVRRLLLFHPNLLEEMLGMRPDGSVDLEEARRVLSQYPEIMELYPEHSGPLLESAVHRCQTEFVALLLELGANPNSKRIDSGFPLLYSLVDIEEARRPDALRIAELLIKAGVNIEQRGINDWTPLHRAACGGNVAMVKLLIQHGADVNARTEIDDFTTPLMEAALGGDPEIIRLLLEIGADPMLESMPTAPFEYRQTAEDIAEEHNHLEAARVIREYRKRRGLPRRLASVD